jgi:hypothetical protein
MTFTLLGCDGETLALSTGGSGGTLEDDLVGQRGALRSTTCWPSSVNCDRDEIDSASSSQPISATRWRR